MNSKVQSVPRCSAPVLAVCGFSGSGKTTLLEAAIPHFVARGLSVAVLKHDAHGVVVDRPGKDSDRLFRAGASVVLRGPQEQFQRRNRSAMLSLSATLADLGREHDLLLVEGHKGTPLAKFWLEDSTHMPPPEEVTNIVSNLAWGSERTSAFLDYVEAWLPQAWRQRPLHCGLLIGGQDSRMGAPQHLASVDGRRIADIVATALSYHPGVTLVGLGGGALPESLQRLARLPDSPGFQGQCAGAITAHRWAPEAAWIVAACDYPWLTPGAIAWLASLRRPGAWAIIPRLRDADPRPTLALYEPQALELLERIATDHPERNAHLAALLEHRCTLIVTPPAEHERAWRS